jgi:uncharacterized protein (DUF433 family)
VAQGAGRTNCRTAADRTHRAQGLQPQPVSVWQVRLLFGRNFTTLLKMIDWSQCTAVERIPGKVGGVWLFKGTRVPVKALFENIEGGATVDEFLAWFPGVERAQVDAVLEYAQRSLEPA